MKIVILYDAGDEYDVGFWTVTTPLEYESPEQFLVDYKEWCLKNKDKIVYDSRNYFCGILDNDEQMNLQVLTVDEWFAKCA